MSCQTQSSIAQLFLSAVLSPSKRWVNYVKSTVRLQSAALFGFKFSKLICCKVQKIKQRGHERRILFSLTANYPLFLPVCACVCLCACACVSVNSRYVMGLCGWLRFSPDIWHDQPVGLWTREHSEGRIRFFRQTISFLTNYWSCFTPWLSDSQQSEYQKPQVKTQKVGVQMDLSECCSEE